MKTLLTTLLIIIYLNVNAQDKSVLKIGAAYSIDMNVYNDDPFAEKYVMVIKILKRKKGWVLYQMVKGCCIGANFSQREDIIIDQIKSYNKKYGK